LFHAIKVVKISEILSDFRGRAFFLALLLTFGGMKMLPIAGDFLSSYTKVEAGYNP